MGFGWRDVAGADQPLNPGLIRLARWRRWVGRWLVRMASSPRRPAACRIFEGVCQDHAPASTDAAASKLAITTRTATATRPPSRFIRPPRTDNVSIPPSSSPCHVLKAGGQKVVKRWSKFRQTMVKRWSNGGRSVAKRWSNGGQKTVKK